MSCLSSGAFTVATAPAAAADRPPDRYVVRPAGVLAELLGSADVGEEELLLRLRELGLITYPSPLLKGLTEGLPELLAAEVLTRLDPTDVVLFGQADRACRAAVVASGAPKEERWWWIDNEGNEGEGFEGGPLCLRVSNFVGSIERLAWAKEMGCQWDEWICEFAAEGGNLQVLRWAREHGCKWNQMTCAVAASRGHLEVLRWAHDHGCPGGLSRATIIRAGFGGHLDVLRWAHEHGASWDAWTCSHAASQGQLHVLQYARENGCPWDEWTCYAAARGGHLEVLQWAREHNCPWTAITCFEAARGGHLEVLRWAREHGCPWTAATRHLAATKGYADNIPLSV